MTNYSEKLRDPRWQKKRLEILDRDKFTCQLCNDKKTTLNVHHKEYISGRDVWQYSNKMLITYCETCHLFVEYSKKLTLEIPLYIIKTDAIFNHEKMITAVYKTGISFFLVSQNVFYYRFSIMKKSLNKIIKSMSKHG